MDLIYIVSAGSNSEELKFSIRSMEKHLQGLDRIFVVGHCPPNLNLIHIPAEDKYPGNRSRNIHEKILIACAIPDLSEQFVCASDDHFLLKDFDAERLPTYRSGCLTEELRMTGEKNYYRKHIDVTIQALADRGLTTHNFNVHFPVVYNKILYPAIMNSYNWDIPKGYLSKSLFLNSLRIEGEEVKDCKIHTPKTKTAIYRKIKNSAFFSTNDGAINPEMLEVWNELYPNTFR